MLYGVAPFDPITVAGVATVLAIASALSTFGPAWRAARVLPIEAMRG